MSILNIVAGPLVGAAIGYFTNYIAVKMLFRPLYPVKIGGYTLPFTPGIIPRRKRDMARAVGQAVGGSLLTESDMEAMLLSEDMEERITREICTLIYNSESQEERTIKNMLKPRVGGRDYAVGREILEEKFCSKILEEMDKLHLGEMIAREGKEIIREKTRGGFLEMMISDDLIESITGPVGEYIENYIRDNGHDMLLPIIDRQIGELEDKPIPQLMEEAHLNEDRVRVMAGKAYRTLVERKASDLVEGINIARIVEDKINAMDVKEIEDLALSVMEHELKAIVSLGAVIGFVIGIVNIFL